MEFNKLTIYVTDGANYIYLPSNESLLVFKQYDGRLMAKIEVIKTYDQISFGCIFNNLPNSIQANFEKGVIDLWKSMVIDAHLTFLIRKEYAEWAVRMVEKYDNLPFEKIDVIIDELLNGPKHE